jgi:putative ABC transport system permease protein
MKYLPFVLKHMRHTWFRTTNTILAMAVCVCLLCTLETVIAAVNWGLRGANTSRLVVRNAVSLFYTVPLKYAATIRTLAGVKRVSAANFYVFLRGSDKVDYGSFFRYPTYAVDAEEYLGMYPELILSAEERRAFLEDTMGCIVGPEMAREFGWKVGGSITLRDGLYSPGRPIGFVVRGVYRVDDVNHPGTDGRLMLFHHRYLAELSEHRAQADMLVVEIDDPARAGAIAAAIDATFDDTDRQTHTEPESAFRAGMITMAGNLANLLHLIGIAVVFAILVVTANTMSMAVRERRRELGVLKTLGFDGRVVMALVLAEALAMGLLGGLVGVALGRGTIGSLRHVPLLGDAVRRFPSLGLSFTNAAIGLSLALAISLAAAFIPALAASRARATELLRAV